MDSLAEEFKPDDFVWAKMSSYPPWPAIIMKLDPHAPAKPKEKSQWIYFFGTHNYAWIEERHLKHYEAFKEKFKFNCKTPPFKKSVEEAENNLEELSKDPSFKIEFVKYMYKEREHTPKKPRKSGVKRPLKEKNSSSPHKRNRSSLSADMDDNSDTSAVWSSASRSQSVSVSPTNMQEVLKTKDIAPSSKVFGLLGLNGVGSGIAKNLITSGHRVNLWNRNTWVCEEMEAYADPASGFVKTCCTPREVVRNSDVVFSCLSDTETAKHIIQEFGIMDDKDDLLSSKGYVEMTGLDLETSKDLAELIENKGGQYLEAQVQGGKTEAQDGSLIVLTAGSKQLYVDCQSCFKAMSKASFYLGTVGYATKINLIVQVMRGIFLAGLTEGFAMADRCGISPASFLDIFNMTNMASPYLSKKADFIVNKKFSQVEEGLQHLQRDMSFALELSNRFRQPMPLASTSNEIMKHARRLGYDNHDASCIYQRTRH